jgi:hypothetical protein
MLTEPTSISPGFEYKFISFVGKIGVLFSIMLFPPVFKAIFSVSDLVLNESKLLWVYSILFLIISLLQIISPKKIKASFSLFLFVLSFFIFIEFITRLYVNIFYETTDKKELGMYANRTYQKFAKYKGHPFIAYTGNPDYYVDNFNSNGKQYPFNNMGFVGNNFNYENTENKIRVACIGGSTTERGYPAITEYQLNKLFKDSLRFEVMNFGVSGWTSANSLVNYILNVKSFNPDYVLIHHGWNESRVRNTPESLFRTDYSHALTYFHEPEIIDKLPIRLSVLYRILKIKYAYTPDWLYLGDATTDNNRQLTELTFNNGKELDVFARNINTIVDLCLLNNTKVILSTQPFSLTKEDITSKAIEQANDVIRAIYSKNQPAVLLLDLDNAVTGNMNNIFTDLAHMNHTGTFYKGSEFARMIINNINNDTIKHTPPYILNPISYHSFIKKILNQKEEKEKMQTKANERGISLHEILKKDALYNFNNKNKQVVSNKDFDFSFQEYKIRNNPEWIEKIKVQAKERGISVEENLKKNINSILKK